MPFLLFAYMLRVMVMLHPIMIQLRLVRVLLFLLWAALDIPAVRGCSLSLEHISVSLLLSCPASDLLARDQPSPCPLAAATPSPMSSSLPTPASSCTALILRNCGTPCAPPRPLSASPPASPPGAPDAPGPTCSPPPSTPSRAPALTTPTSSGSYPSFGNLGRSFRLSRFEA